MKDFKRTLLIAGSLCLAVPVFAQMGDGMGLGGPGFGEGPMGGAGVEIPSELVDLRLQVVGLRADLYASRGEALEALAEDATVEERRAVLDQWREDNAEQLAELEELTEELHAMMDQYRPGAPLFPNRPNVPDEVKQARQDLVAQRQALRESRQAVLAELGEDATEEEIRAALEQWRIDNEEAIQEAHQLAQEIRGWFRENRPARPHRPGDPEDLVQARADMRAQAQLLRENRRQLREQLRNASEEERLELLRQFREEQKDLMRQQKELKRQERLNDGATGGDRRPGTGG